MQITVAGGTGFIGAEAVRVCRNHSQITSILVLSRRPLPKEVQDDPKVFSIVLDDFITIPTHVQKRLQDSYAVLWTLRASTPEVEAYPVRFAEMIQPQRFVHVSGILAERDQQKMLWFLQAGRRLKGQVELDLLDMSHTSKHEFQPYIVRPSMVLQRTPSYITSCVGRLLGAIKVNDLAEILVDIATNGADQNTFEHSELIARKTQVSGPNLIRSG